MRRISKHLLIASLAIVFSAAPMTVVHAQTGRADGAAPAMPSDFARQRATQIAGLLHAGESASVRRFLTDSLSPESLGSIDRLTSLILRLADRSRGLESSRVEPISETIAHLTWASHLTGETLRLEIEVEPAATARIRRISQRPAPPENSSADIPDSEPERLAVLDSLADRITEAGLFSGVILIARNGVPIFERAYGLADRATGRAINLDTRFNIGSMNKAFTALAIGRLVEQGRLSWDDPLSRYMPEFPDAQSAARIRISHLLSHTSGLGSYFNERFSATPMTVFRDLDAYFSVAGGEPLRFEPGTNWFYSNTGMLALGRVIERASGEDYYQHIQRVIYDASGMTDSGSFHLDQPSPNTAIPYEIDYSGGGRVYLDATNMLPVRGSSAGGGLATARDLLRFSTALRNGRIVRLETLALMSSPKTELSSERYGYGIALERFAPPGRDIVGHGGDAFGTCAIWGEVRDTADPYTVIILANSPIGSCHIVAERAYQMLPPGPRN